MLLKCTVRIIYVNYQRLENAGKQNIRKISKILFTRKKKSLLKSQDNAFQIFVFFSVFPCSFCIFLQALDGVYEYMSVFGCMPVSLYM